MIKQIYRSVCVASVFFLLLGLGTTANAQSRVVTGKIKDSAGQALPGVNVIKKGTTTGTSTDSDGAFSIEADNSDVLVFSFIGYSSQEIQVGAQTNISVVMIEDITTLETVVATGYGELRKSDVSSAQSTISSKDIGRTINTTIDQAIQGRTAGVYVTQNTGAPGGGVSINIRGVNSINGSNEPLYVIDGVQILGSTSQTGTNPLSNLNPSDIENMEILQGPNATAIYGSRGTNGVVVITTKRGKSGAIKVTYDFMNSLQEKPKDLSVMNLQQYAQMYLDYKNAIGDNSIRDEFRDPSLLGKGTDWQKSLFRVANMQKHQLSISGGSDKSTFFISAERMKQDGIGPNSGFDRTSVRFNTDNKLLKWLSLSSNINVSQTDQKLGTLGNGQWNNLILTAIQLAPDIPVRNLDGSFAGGDPSVPAQQFSPPNAVGLAAITTNKVTTRTLIGGLNATIKLLKGLEFKTNFNTNIGYSNSTSFLPTYSWSQYAYNKTAVLTNQTNLNTYWGWNQMLTYTRDFGKHHLNAMATHEAQLSYYKNLMGSRQGFSVNNILDLNVGDATTSANGGGQGYWALESYLGRINYNYGDRYIVTLAGRADGSAYFAPANKWGYFPSVSAAYRISNESFFRVPWINDLRLRYETGITGFNGANAAIYGRLNTGTSQWGSSFFPQVYGNPKFKWEQTKTNNFGLTFGLFNGRVQVEGDYYIKKSSNLIIQSTLPWYMGTSGTSAIGAPVVNVGSLQNKGWSIALNTININSSVFKWETSFNISAFKTTVTSLTSGTGQINRILGNAKGNSPFTERTVVGKAPWQFVGNIQQGVFQSVDDATNSARPTDSNGNLYPVDVNNIYVGDAKYKDVDGNGKIDQNDLTFIGNPWPKWFGGMTNTFTYKGISLSVLITYNYGNQIYNITRDEETNPNNINVGRNMMLNTRNFAHVANDADGNPYLLNPGTSVPRLLGNSGVNNNFSRYTNTYVEDGSYARLKNVTLSYSLPATLISKQNLIHAVRLAISGQNLYTWTHYKGYDPEVGAYVGPSYGGDAMVGIDYGRYPLTRVYSFSIGVDF